MREKIREHLSLVNSDDDLTPEEAARCAQLTADLEAQGYRLTVECNYIWTKAGGATDG